MTNKTKNVFYLCLTMALMSGCKSDEVKPDNGETAKRVILLSQSYLDANDNETDRVVFEYDKDYNRTAAIYYSMENGNMVPDTKREYKRNSDGLQTDAIEYTYKGGWEKEEWTKSYYVNKKLVKEEYYVYEAGEPKLHSTSEFNFDKNGNRTQALYTYYHTTWSNDTTYAKTVYSNYSGDFACKVEHYDYDETNGEWKIDFSYNYTLGNDRIKELKVDYIATGSHEKKEYKYNDKNLMSEQCTYFLQDGVWMYNTKYLCEYDDNNCITRQDRYHYENDTWVKDYSTIYTYRVIQ